MEIAERGNALVVRYCRPEGGPRREFGLRLRYLNGTTVSFTLLAERKKSGAWGVFKAVIDLEETEMPEEAAADFALLRWHVFPRKERGRVLPPIAALWDAGDLVVAACLPPERGGKPAPLAVQERWFSPAWEEDSPDPERLLCWWPDPAAWKIARQVAEAFKIAPARAVDVAFFPFSQWRLRADVRTKTEEMRSLLQEAAREAGGDSEEDKELNRRILAKLVAEEYAAYVRRVRTQLACLKKRGVPARVVLGDVSLAERLFAERGLDPGDPASWAQAAATLPEMPDFVLEEHGGRGPLGAVAGPAKVRAAVSFHSHWPDSPCADMIAAGVFAGSRFLAGLMCWLNPLRSGDLAVTKGAVDALYEALLKRGVREIAAIDGVLPFEVCPDCGGLSFRMPDEWAKSVSVRREKVGRNDPCPCGSGLKYKKCCGAL